MERKLYKRETYLKKVRGFYHDTDVIKVFTGVRRYGKSSIMAMIQDELREQGITADNIIFIDLDDKKYRKVKTDDRLEKAIEDKSAVEGVKYLFVDEIQNVSGFEEVINGIKRKRLFYFYHRVEFLSFKRRAYNKDDRPLYRI